MRKVGFDYPNTCPKIDKAIGKAKDEIDSFINGLLDDACPLLPKQRREELAEGYARELYDNLEDAFETVRATNEDMRSEADSQISDLKSQLNDLELEVKQLEQSA